MEPQLRDIPIPTERYRPKNGCLHRASAHEEAEAGWQAYSLIFVMRHVRLLTEYVNYRKTKKSPPASPDTEYLSAGTKIDREQHIRYTRLGEVTAIQDWRDFMRWAHYQSQFFQSMWPT